MNKKLIRLTESDLHSIIKESVKRVLNEVDITSWSHSNTDTFTEAVEILSDSVLNDLLSGDVSEVELATDLDSCDFTDIQWFFSILSERYFRFTKPFSIKRFNKENKEYLGHDIFEEYVADNWEDILPEDMVESIVDRMDVASITNRNDYGGGSYEVVRELQLGVAKRVCDKIKSKYA